MASDFFSNLGKRITQTAQQTADKTSVFVEIQKLNVESASEEREIEKNYQSIGELICKEVKEGLEVSPAVKELVDAVASHEAAVTEIKAKIAKLKGQRICPGCGKAVDAGAAFCPQCGESLPEVVSEPEKEEPACEEGETEVEAFSAEAEAVPSEEAPAEMHEEVAAAVEEAKATLEAEKAEESAE